MSVEQIIAIDGGAPLMAEVLSLRHRVFVLEQGVPAELEIDELDPCATHLVAVRDGRVVGTLRILQESGVAKIGRVAVCAAVRRAGVGTRLMQYAAAFVAKRDVSEIVLHAQLSVRPFYQGLGYVEEGDCFEEAGIAHIAMRKRIGR